ncbi:MAG: hypothetical protein ACTSRI_01245 [Promethearchaeota archaeon]
MSETEKQSVQYLLEWMTPNGGGLAQWIEHFLNQGDESKLKQINEIFNKIKQIFGV